MNIFTKRLNHLFTTVQPLGREYSLQEVIDGCMNKNGEKLLSKPYLAQLKNGTADNPTIKTVSALAKFFDVPESYFFEEDTGMDQLISTNLSSIHEKKILSIAFRAEKLSLKSVNHIEKIIDTFLETENISMMDDNNKK